MKRILLTLLILLSLSIGVYFVCINFIDFKKNIKFYSNISKNIFPGNNSLKSNIIIFKSNKNISDIKVKNRCENKFNFLGEKNDLYLFNINILDENCDDGNFILVDGEKELEETKFNLNILNKSDLFSNFVDYSDEDLNNLKNQLKSETNKLSKYIKSKNKSLYNLKKYRLYNEIKYKIEIITSILEKRKQKYEIPVKGYSISKELNEIPNAGRPYREHYTDGIHHGWDIIAPKGTPVSALDNGVIIRVVDNFDFEDISNMKKQGKVSYTQKLRNLDILRGKQVWVKTSKGDVVFYSHLTDIYENIVEGYFIQSGESIGTVGSSGVPDRDYTNFHLHFSIMKNPYDIKKIGKYGYEDIMSWEWYLKGLNADEVIKGQENIFKKNGK